MTTIAPVFLTGLARIPGDGRSSIPRAVRAFTPHTPTLLGDRDAGGLVYLRP
jgi:hypothetical protein